MFNSFKKSYASAIKKFIHDTGIECYKSITVRVSAKTYTTILRSFGHHHSLFYGIERTAATTQYFPGCFVGFKTFIPGGDHDRFVYGCRSNGRNIACFYFFSKQYSEPSEK